MITLVVTIIIKPNCLDAFLLATKKAQKLAREEFGCKLYEISQDDYVITLIEVYTNEQAIDIHKESQHFLEWKATTKDMATDKQVSFYISIDEN